MQLGGVDIRAGSARPYYDLGFIAKTVHVELDAKLCNANANTLEFLKLETSSAGIHAVQPGFEGADVALTVNDKAKQSALAVEWYEADGSHGGGGSLLAKTFPIDTWFHVTLDVVFSIEDEGSATLTIDRASTPLIALTNVRTLSASPSAMRVLVGSYTNQAPVACTTLIDNLLVEAAP